MRLIVFALLLPAILFADVYLQSVLITINVNPDGSANIQEDYKFILTGLSIGEYVNMLENSSLADWANFLGEVNTHISSGIVKDLEILPQPLSQYNVNEAKARGQLILKYNIPANSLFTQIKVKPRVVRLQLNETILSFKRTDAGHIILDKKTTLQFVFPSKLQVIEINPIPSYQNATSIYWRGTVLPSFRLIFERRLSYGEEIMTELKELEEKLLTILASEDGIYIVGFSLAFMIFYIMLTRRLGG